MSTAPITALIAEDEAPQREALARLLAELWPELKIVAQCADGLDALEALIAHRPRVAFLDIRMPGMNGLALAREASRDCHIVFTTAYDEYAVRAFDEGAVDYVLKPVQPERLARALVRVRERLRSRPPSTLDTTLERLSERQRAGQTTLRWITAGIGDTVRLFPIEDVLYFQAEEKYTKVVTREEEALIRASLRELLEGLDPEAFWQVHRSVIVRAAAIEWVKRDELGKARLRVRGREELLPVSPALQGRFKGM